MYFNVNFNVFFLNKNLHLLVSELYIYQMHGATIKKTCTCFVLDYVRFTQQVLTSVQQPAINSDDFKSNVKK